MTGLEEFYVITETGICVFSKTQEGHRAQDVDLIAGYINALNAFSIQMTSDHIQSVHFQKSKLIINNRNGMQFVARVGKEEPTPVIRQKLEEFAGHFFKMFPPEFLAHKWRGNMDCFKKVNGTFNQSFQDICTEMRIAM